MQKTILTDSMMCVVLLSPPSMSTVVLLASLFKKTKCFETNF